MTDHPSYFELDRIALGNDAEAATRTHVATCVRCQHHISQVGETPQVASWVRDLDAAKRTHGRWWLIPSFALATAAALLLLVLVRRPAEPAYTSIKGTPTVLIHLKRGDDVRIWDAAQPVLPHDRLRLEIAASEYRHVRVLAVDNTTLFESILPPTGQLLFPVAWEVDAQPGPEVLVVVLTNAHGGEWRRTFVLPKRSPGELPR